MRVIGDHYGFSSRLQAIMIVAHAKKTGKDQEKTTQSRPVKSATTSAVKPSGSVLDKADVEQGSPTAEAQALRDISVSLKKDLGIYGIVKDTMGFTSVDQGPRCMDPFSVLLCNSEKLTLPSHLSWCQLASRTGRREARRTSSAEALVVVDVVCRSYVHVLMSAERLVAADGL